MTLTPAQHPGSAVHEPRSLEAAQAAGRQVAAEALSPAVASSANPVEAMARAAVPRLRSLGMAVEVVRARRDTLVVRSGPGGSLDAAQSCALVGAWLEALPRAAFGTPGTVAESACSIRGSRTCIHTLMWAPATRGAPSGAVALPPTLSHSPHGALTGLPPVATDPIPIPIPVAPAVAPEVPSGYRQPSSTPPGAGPVPGRTSLVPAPPPALWPAAPAGYGSAHGQQPPPPPEESRRWRRPGAPSGPEPSAEAGQRWAWARRRVWIIVAGVIAGALGGFVAGGRGGTTYSATSVFEVKSGASTSVAASANGAEVLAVTYAALIPDDQSLLQRVGNLTGVPASSVAGQINVQAVAGTSLLDVHFSAPSPAAALAGANDVARVLTAAASPGPAIARGSISLVSTPHTASRSGSLRKYGLPMGTLLGLVVGGAGALLAERADRRVDDLDALSAAAGCSATMIPGGISTTELARAVSRAGEEPVTVVPLRRAQERVAQDLARDLGAAWPLQGRGGMAVGTTFEVAPEALSDGAGQIILVVGAGERARVVAEAAERLRLLDREPVWAVLVPADVMPVTDGSD